MENHFSGLDVLKRGFERGFEDSHDLRYARVEGPSTDRVAEYLQKSIAEENPTSEIVFTKGQLRPDASLCDSIHFFFGNDIGARHRFASLAREGIRILEDGMGLVESGRLPKLHSFYDDHPGLKWMAFFIELSGSLDSGVRPRRGRLEEYDYGPTHPLLPSDMADSFRFELFLPGADRYALPRRSYLPEDGFLPGERYDTRIPEWKEVFELNRAGGLGEVGIVESSVWMASLALVALFLPGKHAAPNSFSTRLNDTEEKIKAHIENNPFPTGPEIASAIHCEPNTVYKYLQRDTPLYRLGYRRIDGRQGYAPPPPLAHPKALKP